MLKLVFIFMFGCICGEAFRLLWLDRDLKYTDKIEDFDGALMTVKEFKSTVKHGGFIDYDGYGYPVRKNKANSSVTIIPSEVSKTPKDATHIIWFNR